MSNSNFPSIGDIVMSPHDKFKDADGVEKFDQLQCDGGYIHYEDHPEYYDKQRGNGEGLKGYISTALRGGINWEDFRHEPRTHAFWPGRFGQTYGRGINASRFFTTYGVPTPGTTGTNSIVWEDASHLTPHYNMYIYSRNASGFRGQNRLRWLDKNGVVILYLDQYVSGGVGYFIYTLPDREPVRFNSIGTVNSVNLDYDSVSKTLTGSVAASFTIPVDLDLAVSFAANSVATTGYGSSGHTTFSRISNKRLMRPNMTSPDASVPYRVVADLTGE